LTLVRYVCIIASERLINYIMKGKNMNTLNATQTEQVEALFKEYGRVEVSRSEINDFSLQAKSQIQVG